MKTKKKMLRLGALLMTALLFLASPVSAYATDGGGAPSGAPAGEGADRDAVEAGVQPAGKAAPAESGAVQPTGNADTGKAGQKATAASAESVAMQPAGNAETAGTGAGGVPTGDAGGPIIDRNRTGSLTIYQYDKKVREDEALKDAADLAGAIAAGTEAGSLGQYGVAGVEFTYVKISDLAEGQERSVKAVDGNEISTGVTTVFEMDDALKGILWPTGTTPPEGVSLGSGRTGYTTTQLNAALDALYRGGGDGMTGAPVAVKNALESYIKTMGETSSVTTDAKGMAKAEDLPLGLYLVVETGVPRSVTSTVNPFFVSIPMTNAEGTGWDYDITVYPKDQLESEEDKPTLDKYVRKVEGSGDAAGAGNAGNGEVGGIAGSGDAAGNTGAGDTDDAGAGNAGDANVGAIAGSGEVAGNADSGDAAENTGAGNAGSTDKKEGYQDVLSASFGDELEYRVVCRLPAITSEATYLTELAIKDEVTGGLEYADGSFRIDLYEEEADAKAGTGTPLKSWTQQDSQYLTVFKTEKTDLSKGYADGRTITVSAAGLEVLNRGVPGENGGANYSGKYMAVTYRAELVPDGASLGETPNRNHARLHWKRTGGGILDPDPGPEDETPVFTYGIRIDKTFYRGARELEIRDGAIKDGLEKDGVKFRLRKEGSGYVTAKEAAKDASTDTPGTDPGDSSTDRPGDAPEKAYDVTGFVGTEADATPLSPGNDGELLLRGLSAGTYILEETETLSDFALLVNDVTITIKEAEAELVEAVPETGAGPAEGMEAGTEPTTGTEPEAEAEPTVDTEPGTDAGPTADTAPGNDTAPGTGRKTWVVTRPATATVSGLGDAGAEVEMESYTTEDGKTSMNALVRLEVINKALPFLADTGGMGILPFILGGGALILLSLLLLWRRKKKSVTAGMMAFVVLAGTIGAAASFETEAVDLTEKCSLTVETRTDTGSDPDSGIPDGERPDLVVDLYKIADAVPEGSDVTGNEGPRYDMYTLKLTDGFKALQGTGADGVTQTDLDAVLYADNGAGTHDSYLALADRATRAVLGIQIGQKDGEQPEVTADPAKTPMQAAASIRLSKTHKFTGLDAGLYLVIPHGAALTEPEEYTVALGDGSLATVAYGRQYSYRYAPELVALPQRDPTKAGGASGTGNAGNSDAWLHDVTATLKSEAGSRYASLKIVKERVFGTEEGAPTEPGLTGEDHFVYQVEATFGGKSVYSNVVMLTMPADKTQAERTLELIVPVGAKIRVTEVYTGASHDLTATKAYTSEAPAPVEGTSGTATISSAAKDTAAGPGNTVEFTNKYNGTGTSGGAVENQFTYGEKDDGDKGWNWSPVPETAEKTGTQTP